MMRSVSFVENIELEFNGNLFNDALILEDVDNDGNNELIVGNVDGELFVFKGEFNSKPWKTFKHDGMITCIIAGDLWNTGKNVLMSITADGWSYIFDFEDQPDDSSILKVTFSQILPSNTKTALIVDIDGDGKCELITAHTDRVVFVHKWEKIEKPVIQGPPKTEEDSLSEASFSQKVSGGKSRKDSKEDGKMSSPDSKQIKKVSAQFSHESQQTDPVTPAILGMFVVVNSWTLASQMTSLVVYKCMGHQYLLVSQPGGIFINLTHRQLDTTTDPETNDASLFNFHLPFSGGSKNSEIPTCMEAISHKHTRHSPNIQSSLLALGMLDGNISLMDQEQILWTLPLEKNLLTLSKLDITSDGYEEIITCAWDGSTYIIDSEKNIVNFQFHESVMAFNVGYFGMESGNVPCLVYVTFSNTIFVYWNISLSRLAPNNLLTVMESKKEYRKTLKNLGLLDDDIVDELKFKDVVTKYLYGKPCNH